MASSSAQLSQAERGQVPSLAQSIQQDVANLLPGDSWSAKRLTASLNSLMDLNAPASTWDAAGGEVVAFALGLRVAAQLGAGDDDGGGDVVVLRADDDGGRTGLKSCVESCETEYSKCGGSFICDVQAAKCLVKCALASVQAGQPATHRPPGDDVLQGP